MKIESIQVQGRRWFQKSYGNTYHSAKIWVNGEEVPGVDFAYGYDDHYRTTAFEKLVELGYLKKSDERTFLYAHTQDENEFEVIFGVEDVDRQRDIKNWVLAA